MKLKGFIMAIISAFILLINSNANANGKMVIKLIEPAANSSFRGLIYDMLVPLSESGSVAVKFHPQQLFKAISREIVWPAGALITIGGRQGLKPLTMGGANSTPYEETLGYMVEMGVLEADFSISGLPGSLNPTQAVKMLSNGISEAMKLANGIEDPTLRMITSAAIIKTLIGFADHIGVESVYWENFSEIGAISMYLQGLESAISLSGTTTRVGGIGILQDMGSVSEFGNFMRSFNFDDYAMNDKVGAIQNVDDLYSLITKTTQALFSTLAYWHQRATNIEGPRRALFEIEMLNNVRSLGEILKKLGIGNDSYFEADFIRQLTDEPSEVIKILIDEGATISNHAPTFVLDGVYREPVNGVASHFRKF